MISFEEKNKILSMGQRFKKISLLSLSGRQMLLGLIKAQNKDSAPSEIYSIYVRRVLGDKLAEEFLARDK